MLYVGLRKTLTDDGIYKYIKNIYLNNIYLLLSLLFNNVNNK